MSKEIILGIYKIISPSGKIYIGYTINKEKRFRYYKSLNCNNQRYLISSLKKYGVENHKFEMVHIFDKGELTKSEIIKELKKLETHYIKEFNSFVDDNPEFGMNLTRGGEGCENSKETILKRAKSNTGKKRTQKTKDILRYYRKGKKRTEDSIQKQKDTVEKNGGGWSKGKTGIFSEATLNSISQSLSGKNSPNYGKKGILNPNFGKPLNPKSLAKRQATNMAKTQEEKDAIVEKREATKRNKTPEEKALIIQKMLETTKINKEKRLAEKLLIEEEKRIMIFY